MPDTLHLPDDGQPVIGGYRVLSELGRGQSGRVFLAQKDGLARTFALKLLDPGLEEATIARCERGAQAVANLQHPGIARPVAIGRHEGRLYVAMEHIPGETLADRLKRGPLPWPEACELVGKVADAVAVAHRAGVVHRDLKPANIMIDRRDGQPKVLDFGLARDTDPRSDVTDRGGGFLGTPSYMGPEQVRGEPGDTRTDVYALGALLYETIAGRPPLGAPTIDALCLKILHEPPQPLRQVVPALPASVDDLVTRCLAKGREARPVDASALARELHMAGPRKTSLSSLRVVVGQPSTLLVATVLVLCACLVVVTAWGAWERGRFLRADQRLTRDAQDLREARARVRELEAERERAARSTERARRELAEAGREREQVERRLADAEAALAKARLEANQSEARRPPPTPTPASGWSDAEVAALIDWLAEHLDTPERALAARLQLLHDRGRFDDCLRGIEAARAAGSTDPYLRALEARTHLKRGDQRAGQLALQALLAEAPRGSPERLFARILGGDPNGMQLLAQAEAAAPQAGYLRVLRANILRGQARAQRSAELAAAAVRAADEAVRIDPSSYQGYAQRGLARFEHWQLAGRPREGAPRVEVLGDLRKARALHPDPALTITLCAAALALGGEQQALECWVQALESASDRELSAMLRPLSELPARLRERILQRVSAPVRARIEAGLRR